jgi:carbon-monoxide dehydrogenase medium subunit
MQPFVGSRNLPNPRCHHPESIRDALNLLHEHQGECRIAAGCTDLIPAIRKGAWHLNDGINLIDITGIRELKSIIKDEEHIRIGAATPLSHVLLSELVNKEAPILVESISEMASLQVRNRGTIGGNLCTASPAADTVPPLLALNARVKIQNIEEDKIIPLSQFFTGTGKTMLGSGELLAEIRIPVLKPDEKASYMKLGRRNAFTLSVVSVAVWVKITENLFKDARIAMGAVAPTPVRAEKTERYLLGKKAETDIIKEAVQIIAEDIHPISDVRASREYRMDMAKILTGRALTACVGR